MILPITPPPSFQREVLPILRTACFGCHSAPAPAGGISLGSYAELVKGGKSGAAIVPGKASESLLVKMLTGAVKPLMPPSGGGLKPKDIDTIRRWVDAGAKNDVALSPAAATNKTLPANVSAALPRPKPLGALRNVPTPVQTLVFSPDGKTLAVGTYQRVLLCDPVTRQVTKVWGGHSDAVRAVVFSVDGKWLAAGGGTSGAVGEVRLWSVADGREVRTFGNQSDAINAVAFSPDGKILATGSADKTIQLWDVATGKPLQTLRDHADAILGLAFRADGKFLASCSADRSFKVWDTATWRRLYTVGANEEPVTAVAFGPGAGPLLTTSTDHTTKVWNVNPDGSGLARTLGGHGQGVFAVAVTTDGQFAATGSADKTVKLWKVADGANTATLTDPKDWVYAVRFSPDGKELVAGTFDGQVYFWNVETRKLDGTLTTTPVPERVVVPQPVPKSPPVLPGKKDVPKQDGWTVYEPTEGATVSGMLSVRIRFQGDEEQFEPFGYYLDHAKDWAIITHRTSNGLQDANEFTTEVDTNRYKNGPHVFRFIDQNMTSIKRNVKFDNVLSEVKYPFWFATSKETARKEDDPLYFRFSGKLRSKRKWKLTIRDYKENIVFSQSGDTSEIVTQWNGRRQDGAALSNGAVYGTVETQSQTYKFRVTLEN